MTNNTNKFVAEVWLLTRCGCERLLTTYNQHPFSVFGNTIRVPIEEDIKATGCSRDFEFYKQKVVCSRDFEFYKQKVVGDEEIQFIYREVL